MKKESSNKQLLVLGGYGGTGRSICRNLLQHTNVDLVISGRKIEKAENFAKLLEYDFPGRNINAVFADAANKESLLAAFKAMDLVIVAATTPDYMDIIAEAAIATDTDVIDILVRGDVVDTLQNYQDKIKEKGRVFITQAGIHPGLPAPFIRYAQDQFDEYHTGNVAMVMNELFETPESTYEVLHDLGNYNPMILKDGAWKKATYKDSLTVQFSDQFGKRLCYPMQMRELFPLKAELNIRNMGVYVAGFNWFIDYIVFPLAMLLQWLKKGLGIKFCGWLMFWGAKLFYKGDPGIEYRLEAKGIKEGREMAYTLVAISNDAYHFTAVAVVACLKQYLDHTIPGPGLYLMGNVVDCRRLIEDMREMGVEIT